MKRGRQLVGGQTDIAVALRYDGKRAPRVTAKGEKLLAEQIVEAAQQAGVPLYPDPELAMILSQIPLGEEIPDNLYKAIAEVIAFAYILAGKLPEGFVPPGGSEGSDSH
ncbi:MAG: EscU/YscU/HrcU family type III secretion system export apparatus switch protein [Chromatiaceae bacterium]|jgi:flagellar biosynthesis protein|nr:EscU/YscU/HrcU family type III secretion system export apparatus switch protein [Chromatiaceae bacterium]